MTNRKLGEVVVGDLRSPAQEFVRDEEMIAHQDLGHVLILFVEAGVGHLEVNGRRTAIDDRHILVLDLLQPVSLHFEAISATTAFIPHRLVPAKTCRIDSLHGQVFAYDGDAARHLFHAYVRSLCEFEGDLLPHQLKGISQAAATLCAASFQDETTLQRVANPDLNAAVRQYIQTELVNPLLDVGRIAEHFGVSRAALYRLFSDDGGVVRYIRDRRLEKAMKLLTRGASNKRSRVSAVAYATGFADEKSFSRAFKKRFGYLPREAQPLDPRSSGTNDNPSSLLDWLNPLAA